MVNDKKVNFFGFGFFKNRKAGIDRSADFRNKAVVLNLEAVVGAGEVFKGFKMSELVAEMKNFFERNHKMIKSKKL